MTKETKGSNVDVQTEEPGHLRATVNKEKGQERPSLPESAAPSVPGPEEEDRTAS